MPISTSDRMKSSSAGIIHYNSSNIIYACTPLATLYIQWFCVYFAWLLLEANSIPFASFLKIIVSRMCQKISLTIFLCKDFNMPIFSYNYGHFYEYCFQESVRIRSVQIASLGLACNIKLVFLASRFLFQYLELTRAGCHMEPT